MEGAIEKQNVPLLKDLANWKTYSARRFYFGLRLAKICNSQIYTASLETEIDHSGEHMEWMVAHCTWGPTKQAVERVKWRWKGEGQLPHTAVCSPGVQTETVLQCCTTNTLGGIFMQSLLRVKTLYISWAVSSSGRLLVLSFNIIQYICTECIL